MLQCFIVMVLLYSLFIDKSLYSCRRHCILLTFPTKKWIFFGLYFDVRVYLSINEVENFIWNKQNCYRVCVSLLIIRRSIVLGNRKNCSQIRLNDGAKHFALSANFQAKMLLHCKSSCRAIHQNVEQFT